MSHGFTLRGAALAAGIAAALALAVTAMMRRPDDGPTAPAPTAAASATPVLAASPATVVPTVPPALQPQPAPTPPAPLRAGPIGAEGYGPSIERAHAGDDPAAAWEAVGWLRACSSNEVRRESLEKARAQGVVPELTTQLMVELDAEARRCQTVTDFHRRLLPVLAARAIRAGVPDAVAADASGALRVQLSAEEGDQLDAAMGR
jgi:hypothetical protein